MSSPVNLRPTVAQSDGNVVRYPVAHTPQRPFDTTLRNGSLMEQLGALLTRPARVFDLAALAPDRRILDAVEADAWDLIRGVGLEAQVGARGPDATRSLLGELARKAGACLIEHAHETRFATMLDAFAFVHELTPHEARRLRLQWPVCFASNRYWYLSGQVGAFDRFLTESYAGARAAHDDTRRYYFGGGIMVKIHRYDHPAWGEANRELLNCEVAFLRDPPPGLPIPPLVFFGETLREGWVARGCLDGELLLDLMNAGRPYDATAIVRDVLAQLVVLERAGLYHSDVRTWNVIVGADGHASLIDYGSMVEKPVDCAWPHNVFLSFLIFAREVYLGTTTMWPNIRRPWFNPDGLPEAPALWSMLESPPATWSFARLQQDIGQTPATTIASGVRPILAALETFDRFTDDQRRKQDAAVATALAEKDAAIRARAGDVARLEGELAEARGSLVAAQRALTDTQVHAANLERHIAAIHRSTSWRASAPLRLARRCLDALLRGFRPR